MHVAKKVNPHFHDFLNDWSSGIYFLVGGYGSGKSYHIALKIVLKLLEERRTCLVIREVYDTIRESCFALLVSICAELQLERFVRLTRSPMQMTFQNGSRIIFRGLDRVEKLKSIVDISLIWCEEAAEIKYDGYKELLGRLRHPTLKLHVILSTNPVARSNWTYTHFFTRAHVDDEELYRQRVLRVGDVYYHHSLADDNQFLPSDYIAKLDEMQSYDPDRYRVARLGRFGVNGTRVLPQMEIMLHAEVMAAVDEIPRRHKFTGLDWGFVTSYNALVRVAVDDKNKWLYIYNEFYERGLTDNVFADKLTRLGYKASREVIKCDSAEPKSIRYLQTRGFNALAARKWSEGERRAKLANVKKIKRFKRIIVSDACPNVCRELGELTYKLDRNAEIIEDEFNLDAHTLDATIYALDSYDVTDVKRLSKSDLGL